MIVSTGKIKILAVAAIFLLVSTSFLPIVSSGSRIKNPLVNAISNKKTGDRLIAALSTESKPGMTGEKNLFLSKYIYIYTNYNGVEKWKKVNRLKYFISRLGYEKGIPMDVDGDGSNDIIIKYSLKPTFFKTKGYHLAYQSLFTLNRLSSASIDKGFFEAKLYFSTPRLFTGKTFSIGYRSPFGNKIPETCTVSHVFIPHLLSKSRDAEQYTKLEYVSADPSTGLCFYRRNHQVAQETKQVGRL